MKAFRKFRALLLRRTLEADMAEEMRLHLEQRTREQIFAGVSPAEARDSARRQFGNLGSIMEDCRDQQGVRWLENCLRDVHFGTRQLLKSPAFTVTTILTLAIGIGAVVAIFTAADDLLFRPLPFRDPSRLVRLWERNPAHKGAGQSLVSADNFLDWKARSAGFEDIAAYYEARSVLYLGAGSEELHVQGVTTNFFALLGVEAFRGHLFLPANDPQDADNDPGLVISHRLWQTRFGGDPGAIGRMVRLDSISGVIVGVAPPKFSFGDRQVDLWIPLELRHAYPRSQGRDLNAVGRLKQGIGIAWIQAEMTAIARALEAEDPPFNKSWDISVEPLRDSFTGNVRTSLLILLGAVGLLLITACGNAANLLVARHLSRRAEMAIRSALGAGRWRLVQQLLTESMILAAASGLLGLLLGQLALAGLIRLAPQALTQAAEVSIDLRVVFATVGLTTLTGVLFGLAPALFSAGSDVAAELKSGGRSSSPNGRRLRLWLIAGEIAASMVLLISGCLLLRSLVRLQAVDSGLQADNVLTFHFRVPSPENIGLFDRAIARIAALPGVHAASSTSFLPFDGPPATTHVTVANGLAGDRESEGLVAAVRTVMPRYFEAVGIPFRQGRDFDQGDNQANGPLRFIVNEAFAKRFLPKGKPLGQVISTSMARTAPWGEIVGVVGDVKEGSLQQKAVPTVYYPYGHMTYGQMNLVVRTDLDPMGILPAVRDIMHDLDPAVPVVDARTMEAILGETYARERFSATLMVAFSLVALLLAAVGIYGILSYSVAERTREIGIRLAVGAARWRIMAMVLQDAARFVVPGLLAGMAGAWGATRFLANLLYETDATDAGAFLLAPAILLFVAMIAALLPARRASALDPLTALRLE